MPHDKKRGFITQPDGHGLQARYSYKGRSYSRYFRFGDCPERARAEAEQYLADMREALPGTAALHRKPLNSDHSTSVVGISKGLARKTYCEFRVTWAQGGKNRVKHFGIGEIDKYTERDEARAFAAAKSFRAAYVAARDAGVRFDPSWWDDWRNKFA